MSNTIAYSVEQKGTVTWNIYYNMWLSY